MRASPWSAGFWAPSLLETLIVAIAVIGSALYSTGEVARQPYEIIPYTARHGLPALMGALLLGAVFAKVISTASNYLFSPATNLIEDVFVRYIAPGASNKRILIVSRLAVVLLGCWALYQAIYAPSILEKMLWAYTIYSAALTPVVLAAFYSKRVTAWGAVAAIAAGTVVTLAWDFPGVKGFFPPILAQRDAIFPALLVAVAAMVIVSLFTRAPAARSSWHSFPIRFHGKSAGGSAVGSLRHQHGVQNLVRDFFDGSRRMGQKQRVGPVAFANRLQGVEVLRHQHQLHHIS